MIVTLGEAKQHLRVDSYEDDAYLESLISAAEELIKNTTGISFDNTNNLAKIACLFIVSDLYENRNMTTDKTGDKVRDIVNMILTQLSLSYESGDV